MKAGKAYISSLGTTGLLIASSVLLLLVVGTILAFDRWPTNTPAGSDVVAIGGADQLRPARATVAERRRARAAQRSGDARRRQSRARVGLARARRTGADAPATREGRVISGLPAPDSDPLGGGPMGGASGGGGGIGTRSGGSGGGGSQGGDPAGHLGDAVSQVGPGAGGTVGQIGQAVDQAVEGTPSSLAP